MDRLSPEQETLMTWLELRPSPVCLREMQERMLLATPTKESDL